MTKLPTKLGKEPLIDVVFELRFASQMPASTLLPGLLVSQLQDSRHEVSIDRLPAADLPAQFRDADPNLRYVPLVVLRWNGFMINVGDRSLAITCPRPYKGWVEFRQAIFQVVSVLKSAPYISNLERHGLKYVDFLPITELDKQIASVNLQLSLGSHQLKQETVLVRLEIPDEQFVKIVQIVSNASVTLDGESKTGLIVDVDVIRPLNVSVGHYLDALETMLDETHRLNKETFFACLKEHTVDALEPSYE
jgi:uncharacterized protein (TIGR04255 family)